MLVGGPTACSAVLSVLARDVEHVFETTARETLGAAVADLDSVLSRITALDVSGAGAHGLLAAAAALEAAATAVQVGQARALAALDVVLPVRAEERGPVTVPDLSRTTPHELSAVLGCSVESARTRLVTARTVCGQLPGTLAAATAGHLRWWQVRRVADAVVGLTDDAVAAVDAGVARDVAAGRARSGFTTRLRRHLLVADPVSAERAHDRAVADRRVTVRPGTDGTSWLGGALPAEDAAVVDALLDRLADTAVSTPYAPGFPCPDHLRAPLSDTAGVASGERETRCIDQRRADALSGLSRLALDALDAGVEPADIGAVVAATARAEGAGTTDPTAAGGPGNDVPDSASSAPGGADATGPGAPADRGPTRPRPGGHGGRGDTRRPTPRRSGPRRRGEVAVTVSAETLLGISDAPGELVGYGPITAAHARRIAARADVTWRRVLTDPVSGTLLDRGRTAHTPPAPLALHVLTRDGGQCSRPDCGHRAVDLDHAVPWTDPDGGPGGPTSAANLHGVCRGCHTAKHAGWTVQLGPDGTTTWTTPHHWAVTTPPPDLRPDDRAPRARPPTAPTPTRPPTPERQPTVARGVRAGRPGPARSPDRVRSPHPAAPPDVPAPF